MANIYDLLPEIEPEEVEYIRPTFQSLAPEEQQRFANIYRARRKDPKEIMLFTLLGFIVIAGVQRFMLGQIGMGILYLFTGGLCLIGTIVDLVNYKKMTFEYNLREAEKMKYMFGQDMTRTDRDV